MVSDTATTDDLIHHYDALKIDALNDFENDIEEGDAADADMEEAFVGNELMIMEDDDLLGEDLMHTKSPNDNVHEDLGDQHVRNKQDGSFLMIEANKMGDTGEADGESGQKVITSSSTRSLFPAGNPRRASPRINAKTVTHLENGARGKRGLSTRKATTSEGNQKRGMVDAKHLSHPHQ